MADKAPFLYEKRDGIAYLTLNRPAQLNALLPEMLVGVTEAMRDYQDDPDLTAAILTGAGDRAFCTGGDLGKTLPGLTTNGLNTPGKDPRQRFFSTITKPIIAAVNGHCMAGGMELMLGTDLRVASSRAKFGMPEPKVGLFPAGGATVRLPRQVPWAKAMEILLLGEPMTAQEALAIGLINRVVAPDEVMATAQEFACRLQSNGPLAVQKIKESVVGNFTEPWEDAFQGETTIAEPVFSSADAKEGPLAFMEKRPARFIGL